MYKALVLVRNFNSPAASLDFGDFSLTNLRHPQHFEVRETLSSQDVYINDWLLEKRYTDLPAGPGNAAAGIGGISNDIEDILLLLRLFKVGDVAFVKRAIVEPDGRKDVLSPYSLMNDINSHSLMTTGFQQDECDAWNTFANGLRASQSWSSQWFSVARRFFLRGGANEFSPKWDEVNRVVDYATALESALVPEMDFSRRRISRRAAAIVSDDSVEQEVVLKVVKTFYDIRSSVVHGSALSEEKREWLAGNCCHVELRIRQVLVAALRRLPPDERGRRIDLAALYDPADDDRKDSVLLKFRDIQTDAVRRETATQISSMVG